MVRKKKKKCLMKEKPKKGLKNRDKGDMLRRLLWDRERKYTQKELGT